LRVRKKHVRKPEVGKRGKGPDLEGPGGFINNPAMGAGGKKGEPNVPAKSQVKRPSRNQTRLARFLQRTPHLEGSLAKKGGASAARWQLGKRPRAPTKGKRKQGGTAGGTTKEAGRTRKAYLKKFHLREGEN